MGIAEIPTAAPVIMGRLVIAGPESRHGLKLGGTAELIRPKWNGYSIWGFLIVKVKPSERACYMLGHLAHHQYEQVGR